ncbi:hypothetical protein H634G_11028 [Metarhizium anisopliae BRIP 53293]|uniref:Uncharacterized protein n=1 Tax=Metarhizium anisopliae BRIP 53293 TaxID=1291518 RepID=A0A0D9NIA2_METAN|nr:hypothetical protein H634G_11028 [Metarhizium anisopliae BRIP 53293]KJK85231.1 hypothetical protein H633G_10932 [Metarhizium anisopliae BRIP 53284]
MKRLVQEDDSGGLSLLIREAMSSVSTQAQHSQPLVGPNEVVNDPEHPTSYNFPPARQGDQTQATRRPNEVVNNADHPSSHGFQFTVPKFSGTLFQYSDFDMNQLAAVLQSDTISNGILTSLLYQSEMAQGKLYTQAIKGLVLSTFGEDITLSFQLSWNEGWHVLKHFQSAQVFTPPG